MHKMTKKCIEHFYTMTNFLFYLTRGKKSVKINGYERNMLQFASRRVISPYGEDTHALRLPCELVNLRAGIATVDSTSKARRAASLPTP